MLRHCIDYATGNAYDIEVTGTKAHISPSRAGAQEPGPKYILSPGLVDLQINGFVGVDFNQPDALSVEGIRRVAEAQWALGVTHFLPTVTTNSFEHMDQVFRILARAMEDPALGRSMPAFHMEGPYFSPEDGPRGAHPREHVRRPDWDEFCRWQEGARGKIRLVTLSPVHPGSAEFIARLVQSGVAVAIGHTDADTDQIRAAIDAGASLSTHLGNGSHAMIRRHPNYIWDQMAADELHASLIVDGHHLPPSVVKCMVRSKGPERVILISDAVSLAGLKPGRYQTLGRDVELTPDGAVRLAGTPYLAGAALELPDAVRNTADFAGIPLSLAFDMATRHPAAFLAKHASTSIDLGWRQDGGGSWAVFEEKEQKLTCRLTVVDGTVAYRNL